MTIAATDPTRAEAALWDNPLGTDGFEFVEFTAPDLRPLETLFAQLGFERVARHRSLDVSVFRQGGINLVLNATRGGFAQAFADAHGPGACGIAFRVTDSRRAVARALAEGAEEAGWRGGPWQHRVPAIRGIGRSLIYLVDPAARAFIYSEEFLAVDGAAPRPSGAGLTAIDHLTHNVRQGRMDHFANFYGRIFNFREVRYFDIKGEYTGLTSRALTAPCGKIRIPINESKGGERLDQIEEFIQAYNGEGIQHIALSTDDIIATCDRLKANSVRFMTPRRPTPTMRCSTSACPATASR